MEQKVRSSKRQSERKRRNRQQAFLVNSALLVLGIATSLSGLIIQCQYHLLENPAETTVIALDRAAWNTLHVWTALFFTIAAALHVGAHRKWYVNVWKRSFLSKHRPVVLLTVLTFLTAVSGFIPLFMPCSGGHSAVRWSIIEIHDKLAVLFFIVVLGHSARRFKGQLNLVRSLVR